MLRKKMLKKRAKKCKCIKMITWFFFIFSNIALVMDTTSFKISPLMVMKTNQIEEVQINISFAAQTFHYSQHSHTANCNIVEMKKIDSAAKKSTC
jgi:hypothetical protein